MELRTANNLLVSKLKSLPAAALLLALVAGAAHGQVAVIDVPHTVQSYLGHLMNRMETYMQSYQDKMQYVQEIRHFQQQLVSASKLLDAAMPMTLDFEERALNYGMKRECRSPDGGGSTIPSLASSWRRSPPDFGGDIKQQQHELCQRIVLATNARFNEQIKMLNNIRSRDAELKAIAVRGQGVGTAQGKLDTNKVELDQFRARVTMDMQYMQSALVAYDGLIVSLRSDQQLLAKQALHGEGSDVGMVQGATLKSALQKLRHRDR